MPGRKYQAGSASYRYSINGQEKDKELNENITTALYWEYDSRIVRRWNVDPKIKTQESGYSTFSNNPIWLVDYNGRDTTLFSAQSGIKIDSKKGGVKNAVYTLDEKYDVKKYSNEEIWRLAKPLTYTLGKDSKLKGVSGKSFRANHPLFEKGSKAGDQVFLEDLMDLTAEFQSIVKTGMPLFNRLQKIKHKEGTLSDYRTKFFSDLVTDDGKYDLKSKIVSDGTPSYAGVVIGEWSLLNGTLRRYDDYGNIAFGVFGLAAGFSKLELLRGSEINQNIKNIFGSTSGSGDEQRDINMMETGFYNYDFYKKLKE